jgi:hypothetical protein
MGVGRKFGICLLTLVLSTVLAAENSRRKSGAKDAATIRDFDARVQQYVAQRKKDAGTLPGPTKSATKLDEKREQIRTKTQAKRLDAKPGEIFDQEISTYFRKQIATAFSGARGKRITSSLRRAEPVKDIPLTVNQPYPEGVPLQSMPPTLLLKLPKLPKELEYRIVGRNLVLIDVEPKLVVDILPDAVPAT